MILAHALYRLPRLFGDDAIDSLPGLFELARVDLDLRGDAPDARKRLMDEIMRVREAEFFFLWGRLGNQSRRARDQAHADDPHLSGDEAYHIEYRVAGVDVAAGGVD